MSSLALPKLQNYKSQPCLQSFSIAVFFLLLSWTIDVILSDIANTIWSMLAGYEEMARNFSQSETKKYLNE